MRAVSFGGAVLLTLWFSAFALQAQEAAASRAVERTVPSLPQSCYFVVPPREPARAGKQHRLLVVLPGGTGSRDFLPFVENGIGAQAPADCVVVLVTAVLWKKDQQIVWPTAQNKVAGMRFSTEDYVRAVVAEVERDYAVDPAQRAVLVWSSSGPGIYPLLVAADGPFARGYVAMSIWPGKGLGSLAAVKGRRFVLEQSPDDQVTKFGHVRDAYAALTAAGAEVRLQTYAGGHGWLDAPLPRLQAGLQWLFGADPAPAPVWPAPAAQKPAKAGPAAKPGKDGNLLQNGGFEAGVQGWTEVDNSGRLTMEVQREGAKTGQQSLHLVKTGAMPLDLVTQEVALAGPAKVAVSLQLKSKGCRNAWIKVWLYGDGEEPLHEDVDLVRVPADGDWQEFTKTWDGKGAKRAVLQVVMVLGGELWLDDVVLKPAK